MRLARLFVPLAIAACLAISALPLSAGETAVGTDGEIFAVRSMSLGEVDPQAPEASKGDPVLALEIIHNGVVAERLLVPDTDDPAVEHTSYLFYEAASESTFLLWGSPTRGLGSAFKLAWYQDGAWSDVVEVSGNPFAAKSSPQLLITRDDFEVPSDEGTVKTIRRAIVHLVWWEDDGAAGQVLYSPIVLVDGSYLGANPVFPLKELVESPSEEKSAPGNSLTEALVRRPIIRQGRTPNEIIVGLGNPDTDELVTVALGVIPGQISSLADRAGIHLIEIGLRGDLPNASALAMRTAEFILAESHGIHPTAAEFMASKVRDLIAAEGEQIDFSEAGLSELADRAGTHLIEIGFQVQQFAEPSLLARTLLTVENPEFGGSTGPTGIPPHGILAIEAGRHAAPEISAAEPTLLVSRDGSNILVAWQGEESVEYRVTGEETWTAIRSIPISESMDSADAFRLLEEHIQDR